MPTYNRGDIIPLYHEFADDNGVKIAVENARVRVLHELGDNIYEDMPWADMKPFADGFAAAFDTGEYISSDGEYVIIYKAQAKGDNNKEYIDSEYITIGTSALASSSSLNVHKVRLTGYVIDSGAGKVLERVNIKINTLNGNLVTETTTNFAGQWLVSIQPGDYVVHFSVSGYVPQSVRCKVGDNLSESQFANISLEPIDETTRGTGAYTISDIFTDKYDLGIPAIRLMVYTSSDSDNVIAQCTTDNKGKWRLHLDTGEYLMKLLLPAGSIKVFRLIVNESGKHTLTEFRSSVVETNDGEDEVLENGTGAVAVHDVVLDSHGKGIEGVIVKAYIQIFLTQTTIDENGNEITETVQSPIPKFEYVAGDITTSTGEFNLNLDHGVYRFTFTGKGYKYLEQIITI